MSGQANGSAVSGVSSEGVTFSGSVLNGSISGSFVPTGGGTGSFSGNLCS